MNLPDKASPTLASRLVSREVLCCVSGLVATLANGYGAVGEGSDARDLRELTSQAYGLSFPIPDYESAAREAGAKLHHTEDDGTWCVLDQKDNDLWDELFASAADAARAYCDEHDIEPHNREVLEHWAVTAWLADKLEAKGEKVDLDFAGLIVWARTTEGPDISQDRVIQEITAESDYAGSGEG